MEKLTKKQARVYRFIVEHQQEKGYPPSIREICSGVGLSSTATVHSHLERLEKLGLIRRDTSKPRAIEIAANTPESTVTQFVPLVFDIPADHQILSVDNIKEYYSMPVKLLKGTEKENVFLFKMLSESMHDAGIFRDDILIVAITSSAFDSDIVLARVSGHDIKVKRLFHEHQAIKLQPDNHHMHTVTLPVEEVEIIGKVIGLIREY